MKLSTKSTYGLRALINLAKNYPESLSLAEISDIEKISMKYLEAIFAKFKKAKLINSVKGAGGGYSLAKEPEEISIYDVLESLGEGLPVAYCLNGQSKRYCTPNCRCGVGRVLHEVEKAVADKLKEYNLKNII